ncbi:BPL-N domain-containing protein [Luteibacter sp. 9135]|uniref:BPL-N domain-containing protein n=1 Tax=Luteibacter sp. 9135 TaxID=1500893 RepID=UPI0009E07C72|nr:BPL-N domain-containing protein [Luteibacter sp. 9135]
MNRDAAHAPCTTLSRGKTTWHTRLPWLAAVLWMLALGTPGIAGVHAAEVVRVAVYRGPAACSGCAQTVKESIERLGGRYRVDFVGARERQDISPETLSHHDIYVQPGGGQDIPGALRSLGTRRVDAIRNFVRRGGRYLGLCMGAYLADSSNLGLIDDDLDSEVGRPGFEADTIDDYAVDTWWHGRRNSVFFQDGPYFPATSASPGFRAIATYSNGDIAAARYDFGHGRVVLAGPHPEADETWFDEAGIPLERMPQDDLVNILVQELGY